MIGLDLRRAPVTVQLLPPDLELTPADRDHAVHEWRGRMVSEHASARVFAALIDPMMRAGIAADRQAEVAAMVGEELRHARLCASVVRALGADPVAPMPPLPPVPSHDDVSPREGLLRNILSIACLEETVAVALLEAGRARVAHEPLRGVIQVILADEIGHARFGWRLLAEEVPDLSRAARLRLEDYLAVAMQHLFARFARAHAGPSTDGAVAVGAGAGRADHELFLRTVDEAIIPGLERVGLDVSRALESSHGRPAALQ